MAIEWQRLEEHTGEEDCSPPVAPRAYKRVTCPECRGEGLVYNGQYYTCPGCGGFGTVPVIGEYE